MKWNGSNGKRRKNGFPSGCKKSLRKDSPFRYLLALWNLEPGWDLLFKAGPHQARFAMRIRITFCCVCEIQSVWPHQCEFALLLRTAKNHDAIWHRAGWEQGFRILVSKR